MRTSPQQLHIVLVRINRRASAPMTNPTPYRLDSNAQGWQLETTDKARSISNRLSIREMLEFLHGFEAALDERHRDEEAAKEARQYQTLDDAVSYVSNLAGVEPQVKDVGDGVWKIISTALVFWYDEPTGTLTTDSTKRQIDDEESAHIVGQTSLHGGL